MRPKGKPHRKLSEAEKRRRQEQRDRRPNWGLLPMTVKIAPAPKDKS